MSLFVLLAWLVQAALGLVLVARWARHGRSRPGLMLGHLGLAVAGLASWVAFVRTDHATWGWTAVVLITVGNVIGDAMLLLRWRRLHGARSGFRADYPAAVRAVLTGRMPGLVIGHALVAGVVYFSALATCVLAVA